MWVQIATLILLGANFGMSKFHCDLSSTNFLITSPLPTVVEPSNLESSKQQKPTALDIFFKVKRRLEIVQSKREKETGRCLPVTLCYAQTLDGSIAPAEKTRWEISSPVSWQLLHSLRSIHDGVLVGINTLVVDKPRLNVRMLLPGLDDGGEKALYRQPRPIVLDTELRLAEYDGEILLINPIIVTCIDEVAVTSNKYKGLLLKLKSECGGGDIISCKRNLASGKCDLVDALHQLQSQCNIRSVLVEGGAGILQAFLEATNARVSIDEEKAVVSQVVVTIKPWYLGGYRLMTRQLPSQQSLKFHDIFIAQGDDDFILHGINES